MRWSEEQLSAHLAKDPLQKVIERHGFKGEVPKPSKYRNQKVVTEEGTFDSKWEYSVWCQLKMQERAGLISGLERQVPFELIPSATLDGRKLPAVKYVADFVYFRDGQKVVEDAKGMKSLTEFKLKKRLMYWIHGITVKEIRK